MKQIITLDEDTTGDFLLNIGFELAKKMGWKPGDILTWFIDEDGTISIEKKMAITVEYMPSGEKSPLPGGEKIYQFESHEEFKEWTRNYVCKTCLLGFKEETGHGAKTLGDWLSMGCGCEIWIDDEFGLINWESNMSHG